MATQDKDKDKDNKDNKDTQSLAIVAQNTEKSTALVRNSPLPFLLTMTFWHAFYQQNLVQVRFTHILTIFFLFPAAHT